MANPAQLIDRLTISVYISIHLFHIVVSANRWNHIGILWISLIEWVIQMVLISTIFCLLIGNYYQQNKGLLAIASDVFELAFHIKF